MDLDNLGPIVLFIVYMAITAWSKQKKARQRAKPAQKPGTQSASPISKPLQEVGGILDQLKKELFEIDEEPLTFQQVMPEHEPEDEVEEQDIPVSEIDTSPRFAEGSPEHTHGHPPTQVAELVTISDSGQTLEEVLEPYSRIEQGIILHEILGKPRARQKNEEWFHRS
ncbi:MAG: hypothetical protein H8E26_10685 [FCB group bacterium]|nr:hypothetical protein [FCB group bacterium]MBL7027719.1 hypothetical protein [Candidatus Neomarinimicrobiota bacterium]MBL7121034.1 hypothetical protein [Candidatus Neomarinimicrobiota bacterium]